MMRMPLQLQDCTKLSECKGNDQIPTMLETRQSLKMTNAAAICLTRKVMCLEIFLCEVMSKSVHKIRY